MLSKLEERFLERLEAAGLPLPETNRAAGGQHGSRHAWEQDRHRERQKPRLMLAELTALLSAS